jgi:hypothetical protein
MAAQGDEVHVITLMAPSLADPLGDTSDAQLEAWTTNYDLTSPVLADRGWGIAMFLPAIGEQMGYPSWVVVDPDLNVVQYDTGFGSWQQFIDIINAN